MVTSTVDAQREAVAERLAQLEAARQRRATAAQREQDKRDAAQRELEAEAREFADLQARRIELDKLKQEAPFFALVDNLAVIIQTNELALSDLIGAMHRHDMEVAYEAHQRINASWQDWLTAARLALIEATKRGTGRDFDYFWNHLPLPTHPRVASKKAFAGKEGKEALFIRAMAFAASGDIGMIAKNEWESDLESRNGQIIRDQFKNHQASWPDAPSEA